MDRHLGNYYELFCDNKKQLGKQCEILLSEIICFYLLQSG
jgi:hypothetical protein